MPVDFKKVYKELYIPKTMPSIVNVPKMNFIAVRGKGNPNDLDGEYFQSVEMLYGIAYTLKMSYKSDYKIEGFYEYVVPPLEGFWWQDGIKGVDSSKKDEFKWIAVIRLPDFVTQDNFNWAIETATEKKKKDFSKVEFMTYDEGLCVQCMHIGAYDDELKTVELMENFALENGYMIDITDERMHHEIYISDPRKVDISKLKTVVRHPIKKCN